MGEEHKHPNYVIIWVWLLVLTVLEIGAAQLYGLKDQVTGIAAIALILLLAMALVKAFLVAMYFMHLRFERKAFVVIVSAPLLIALVLVIALLPDVGFR